MSLLPGTRLGPYEILSPLGAGGMGEVYRAEDTRLRRIVAIKVLRADKVKLQLERQRLLQEARAASTLNHPNIVQIHELDSHEGDDFIVMEFVPGRTFAQLLKEKRLTIDEVIVYASQIASALAAAHAAGVVHRDIKPGNIMLSDLDVVKILDFGLAKPQLKMSATESTLTAGHKRRRGPQAEPHLTCHRSKPKAWWWMRAATSSASGQCSMKCSPAAGLFSAILLPARWPPLCATRWS